MELASHPLQGPSLWELLQTIADRRRREGRIYPLASVLGLLIVAGVNGESSLRGKWLWGQEHWPRLWEPLGFKPGRAAPQRGGFGRGIAPVESRAYHSGDGGHQY